MKEFFSKTKNKVIALVVAVIVIGGVIAFIATRPAPEVEILPDVAIEVTEDAASETLSE